MHAHWDHHRPLNRRDMVTLALAALGGALEFYDFVIFVFFTAIISQLFFPPDIPEWLRQAQTFGIFAAGYLARPLGGIVMAHFGDLLGRKKMFALSIFLMSVPTLLMGLLPTYQSIGLMAPLLLLLLRIVQGAAIGGEVPGAWVFVAEHVPAKHTGLACGTLTAGLTGGILLGSLVAMGMNLLFAPAELLADAWRYPFILGGVFGLLSVWLRQWLHETPVFKEMQENRQLADELPLKAVIRAHRPAVLLSMAVSWFLSAAIVVMILMTPTLLQKLYGLTPAVTLRANSFATLALSLSCVLVGWLVDRVGAAKTIIVGSGWLALMAGWLYTGVKADPSQLDGLYALTGFSVGVIGCVPYIMVRAFPPEVRFSGLSFSYNVAYAVLGGLTPVLVSLWLPLNPMAAPHYVISLCALAVLIGLYLWRQERRA